MKQKENQEVLLKVANENTMKMLKSGGGESGGAVVGRKVSSVEAYKSVEEIPTSRDLAIQVKPSSWLSRPAVNLHTGSSLGHAIWCQITSSSTHHGM